MKGKKIVSLIALATLSAGIICGASACSGVSTAAKGMKSEEITAEQWENIFTFTDETVFSNCKMEYGMMVNEVTYEYGVKIERTTYADITITVADDNLYCFASYSQTGKYGDISLDEEKKEEERYLRTNTDGTFTLYSKDATGEWQTSTEAGTGSLPEMGDLIEGFGTIMDYENYVFSRARKGYVLKSDVDGEGCVIKFRDGKLAGLWEEYDRVNTNNDGREKATMSLVIKYGGQKVNLPKI